MSERLLSVRGRALDIRKDHPMDPAAGAASGRTLRCMDWRTAVSPRQSPGQTTASA